MVNGYIGYIEQLVAGILASTSLLFPSNRSQVPYVIHIHSRTQHFSDHTQVYVYCPQHLKKSN